jgi:hypothetical protein
MRKNQFRPLRAEPSHRWFRLGLVAGFAILGSTSSSAQAQRLSKIDLHQASGSGYACRLYERPIQFLSEKALVLMSGPTEDCYRSVDQLELNVVAIDGRILSHKHWPSTDPGIVIAPGSLLLAIPDGLQAVGDDLVVVQSVGLPQHRGMPVFAVRKEGTVSLQLDGQWLIYSGPPLKVVEDTKVSQMYNPQLIFRFADGESLVRDGESLIAMQEGSPNQTIASLKWVVPPCKKYEFCQAYDAGVHFQVSTGQRRRLLVFSNGSRFPITDAAGLFPYFRLQVFDLKTGKELYREEDSFRTGERSASISPDGDLLALFDGKTVVVDKLP